MAKKKKKEEHIEVVENMNDLYVEYTEAVNEAIIRCVAILKERETISTILGDKKFLTFAKSRYSVDVTNAIYSKLNGCMRKKFPYTEQDALEHVYSYSQAIYEKYAIFLDLIDYITLQGIPFIPDKILFCAFMQISVYTYDKLMESEDNQIKAIMTSIDEYLVGYKQTAAENGVINSKASLNSLETKDYGHSIMKPKKDEETVNKKNDKKTATVNEVEEKFNNLKTLF